MTSAALAEFLGTGIHSLDDETARFLARLLTTSTGTHFLDSGGASGRAWQRNRAAVELTASVFPDDDPEDVATAHFLARPPAVLDLRYGYLDITIDVFHWLLERVDYVPELDEGWLAWVDRQGQEDRSWREEVVRFVDDFGLDVRYGGNTYNGEEWITQTLQYDVVTPEIDILLPNGHELYAGEDYVLLQVHGGADVRGGYSRPFLLELTAELYDIAEAWAGCAVCSASWHLTPHGADPYQRGIPRLDELEIVDDEDIGNPLRARHITRAVLAEHDEEELLDSFPPVLLDTKLCPVCGEGEIVVQPPYAGF